MNKFGFERFAILFWGDCYSQTDIFSFNQNGIERKSIKLNTNQVAINKESEFLLGFDVLGDTMVEEEIRKIRDEYASLKIKNYYFFTPEKKQISKIKKVIEYLSLGRYELFGIDPDYFYSFVPLSGVNHKAIEKYIIGMKSEISLKGKVKKLFKQMLVNLNLSEYIYEGFIFIVRGTDHTERV